jgi:DNA-binding response OmpR family regulator
VEAALKKVLLLVPDDVLTGEMRESFLDRGSFTVRMASTAREALDMAGLWRPSLVLFKSDLGDISMPEFCRELRARCENTETKLLMLTDQIGADLQHTDRADYDAHLISPVEPRQLLHTIATLLDVRQRRAPRASLEVLVRTEGFLESVSAEDDSLATSVNVSENGMLLEAKLLLKVGSRGRLYFYLPGSTERVSVSGVVRTVMDEVRLHYAVEFLDLAEHQREMVRQYVREQLGG